jgi:hypothetical protein
MRRLGFILLLLLSAVPALRAAATMEVYTVAWYHDLTEERLTAYWDGATLRVEQPDRRFILLYREKDQLFTGLETRDAIYWKFDWPRLSAKLQEQAVRSRELKKSLLTGDNAAGLMGTAPHPEAEKPPADIFWLEKDGGWIGTGSPRGDLLVTSDPHAPEAEAAFWSRLAQAADILRTVAVREMAPGDLLLMMKTFPARAGAPRVIRWRRNGEIAETLKWVDGRTVPLDPARFAVPSTYRENKLATIDGIFEDAPAPYHGPKEIEHLQAPDTPDEGAFHH